MKKNLSFEDKRRRLTSIKKIQGQYEDQLETIELDFNTKREIMQELVHKVTINPKGLHIELGIVNHASKSVSGSGAGQAFVHGEERNYLFATQRRIEKGLIFIVSVKRPLKSQYREFQPQYLGGKKYSKAT